MKGGNFEVTRDHVEMNISQILDTSRVGAFVRQPEILTNSPPQYAVVGDLDGDYNAFLDMCLEI